MILAILIQSRGQSLGATFGGDTSYYRSRRGAEAVLFNATIVLAVIFVLSVILSILAKK
jgi:protein translocase SecG subunit